MSVKTALITGITGQDGAYLATFLLARGYDVHGVVRRASLDNTDRLAPLLQNGHLHLHYGDMTDASGLIRILAETRADEVYNLAAQSHVKVSFDTPEYTADSIALGTLRLLEGIRILGLAGKTRFCQASTSEMYGRALTPQDETTPFAPCSPYAAAKLHAYWSVVNYRDAYGIHASNAILFNHESPLRGESFVTRKITLAIAAIKAGKQDVLHLGNLDAMRDWGHARDYVEGLWMMAQQPAGDDYVLASGEAYSVRVFAQRAFAHAGMPLTWHGTGVDETGVDASGRVRVRIDPALFRPNEVNHLLGDAAKARNVLGWTPRTGFDALVREMVDADLKG